MRYHRFISTMLFLVLFSSIHQSYAQDATPRLGVMSRIQGELAATERLIWQFDAPMTSTILVRALNSELDPKLTIENAAGDVLAENDDFSAAYGTTARLSISEGQDYQVIVDGGDTHGAFELIVLPGTMHPQWIMDAPHRHWEIANAIPNDTVAQLQTPMTATRLFMPIGAPETPDLYIQATVTWQEFRETSQVGLMVRGAEVNAGQIGGIRLEVDPVGAWILFQNDGFGSETILDSGAVPIEETLTVGLLAQDDQITAFINQQPLTTIENTATTDSDWGLTVFDGTLDLNEFWFATPIMNAPNLPMTLTAWDATNQREIGNELSESDDMLADGEWRLVNTRFNYTVSGVGVRSFLVTDVDYQPEQIVMGAEIQITEGVNSGCGLVLRQSDLDHQTIAYVDTQQGIGVARLESGVLQSNDYVIVDWEPDARVYMVAVLVDQYLGIYINGDLITQAIIPRREGQIGLGMVNFSDGSTTCDFYNVWTAE